MNRRFGSVRIAMVGGSLVALVLAVVLILAESGAGQPGGRAGAIRDAESLLSRLVLPAGARPSAREPAGGGALLSRVPRTGRISDRVDRHGWWVVNESPTVVAAYMRAQTPAGSKLRGWGVRRAIATVRPTSGPSNMAGLPWRIFSVANSRLRSWRSPMAARGCVQTHKSIWLAPKPRWAIVPSTARVLELTAPTLSRTFTQAARYRR